MTEKTFEEMIKEKVKLENWFIPTDVGKKFMVELMQQVREATWEEFRQALLGVTLPAENLRKIGRIVAATDRITITNDD